jgi:hypothetical protein
LSEVDSNKLISKGINTSIPAFFDAVGFLFWFFIEIRRAPNGHSSVGDSEVFDFLVFEVDFESLIGFKAIIIKEADKFFILIVVDTNAFIITNVSKTFNVQVGREDNVPFVVFVPSIVGHIEVGAPVFPVEVSAFVPVNFAFKVDFESLLGFVAAVVEVAGFLSFVVESPALIILVTLPFVALVYPRIGENDAHVVIVIPTVFGHIEI